MSDRSGTESARYVNLLELEGMARRVLPQDIFDFYAGGAADELTVKAARDAYLAWRLLPHVLAGVGDIDLTTELLGEQLEWPVFIAPTGAHRLAHDAGELATASAARAENTLMVASMYSTVPLEAIAEVAGQRWFNGYLLRDRGLARSLIERAKTAGYRAVTMTVDQPMSGRRERDIRNDFHLPTGIEPANFLDLGRTEVSPIEQMTAMQDPTLTWTDLASFIAQSPLPVIAKGVLRADDALRAVEAGVVGVYVSNHGGRQLDSAVPSLDALPAVVEAVGGRVPVLIDGGIRRGTDVVKALALGARAVGIGRPVLYGLALDGAAGVRGVLQLLREELILALALCGRRRPQELDREILIPTDDRPP
jgi:4-hydroxymandelate oxidase